MNKVIKNIVPPENGGVNDLFTKFLCIKLFFLSFKKEIFEKT